LIIDRQTAGANTSRAAVVHARTLETLEDVGVADRLVERGIPASRFTIRDRDRVLMPVHFEHLPTRYPFALMVSQAETEAKATLCSPGAGDPSRTRAAPVGPRDRCPSVERRMRPTRRFSMVHATRRAVTTGKSISVRATLLT
jgi:hypothetical protein